MKKILFFVMAALLLAGCSKDDEGTETEPTPPTENKYDVTVDLKMPGTLASNIPNKEFKTIKISGNLNGTDIKFIRGIIESLSLIDLEDANIVEGGDSYYNITHKTKNNNIGRYMFTNLSGSFEVKLPKSISTIEQEAFLDCKGLKSIVLNQKLKVIEWGAFEGCTQLASISIPEGVKKLETATFRKCQSLKSVQLPTTLEEIEILVFDECEKLNNINFPENLTTIGTRAFYHCLSLNELTLSNNIKTIDEGAFEQCNNLSSIVLPKNLFSIGKYAFRDTNISQIEIPDKVVYIKDNAFENCKNIKTINIAKGVYQIGLHPFVGCINLQSYSVDENNNYFSSINGALMTKDKKTFLYCPYNEQKQTYNIPEGTTTIGTRAFQGCKNINTIIIPSSVTRIKQETFLWAGFNEFHCKALIPPEIEKYLFPSFSDNVEYLYIPQGTLDVYQKSGWTKFFKNVIEE